MSKGKSPIHLPVMLTEVIDSLNLQDGFTIVDGTLGLGGYSEAALQSAKNIKIVAFDLDQENMKVAKERLSENGRQVTFVHDNFGNIKEALAVNQVSEINGIMLDLGLASPQVDLAERGFSFNKEGDLDMRFDKTQGQTAADIINKYSEQELSRIFWQYGEEKKSRILAREIVKRRQQKAFTTTTELAEFITTVIWVKKSKIHPATKVFQALRIEVNQELESLERVLNDSVDLLAENGRIVVVSYHSLEDKIVKNFFRDHAREYVNLPNELTTTMLQPKLKMITKKPLLPSAEEVKNNPRARSAKLRVAEKI